ncbi:MAG TPA: V-type ATP synthase subunit B, partial [Ruminococcaceae bacterium]|nr:V-type ATP synthase subunit B [Oscillospiraceae bacterium]
IGEDELSASDKRLLQFGKDFEAKFISQSPYENRSIQKTLDLGWELLSELPREDLDRVDDKTIEKYYKGK